VADKKRKEQNPGAMQSIFDFIFAETQRSPDKRKPVRPSNIHGASELTDTLVTVLEKPGLYVSDQAMDVLKDTLNVQLAEIYTGTGAPQKKAKIGTMDLISIFKDPDDYFGKLYEKNKRQMKIADYAGKSFRGILAASTAKKMGIDNWEDRWAINRMAADYEDPAERLAIVNEARKLGHKYLVLDSVLAGSKEVLDTNIQSNKQIMADLGKRIDSADIQNAGQLRTFLMNDPSCQGNIQMVNTIMNQYGRKQANFYNRTRGSIANSDLLGGKGVREGDLQNFSDWETLLHKGFKDRLDRFSPENIDMGKDITSKYFQTKGDLLGYSSDSDDKTQAYSYNQLALLMQNLKKTQDNLTRKKIASLRLTRGYIKTLKSLPALSPVQRRELDNFQKMEKSLKSEIAYLQTSSLQDKYYKAVGYYTSMKDIWGKNLAASILDGTFFSDDNKILNPVSQSELGLHMVGEDRIYFNIPDKDNAYCRTMTTVMYLTPKKLLQFDGTYFAYRTYVNRMDSFNKLISHVKDLGSADLLDALYRDIEETNLFAIGSNGKLLINYAAFKDPNAIRSAINELNRAYGDDPDIAALLNRFLEKESRLSKLTEIFSIWARFKENLKNKIDEATIGKIRKKIGENLLARFGGDKAFESAIKLWQGGGGIQNLIKVFVDKFLTKMGFQKIALTTVSGVLTTALSNFAFGMYVILAKVLVVALVGLIFVIGMGASFFNKYTMRYGTVSSVTPGEVTQCEGFESEELVNTGLEDIIVPPPSNATCPLGDAYFACNQGYADGRGASSHNYIKDRKPVDLNVDNGAYFYAPQYCDDGGCRITGIQPATSYCTIKGAPYNGEMVYFNDGHGNVFKLVHVKALVGIQEEVKGGEAVAYIYGDGSFTTSKCWGGGHLHLEITHNGASIDPLNFLQAMGCNVPSESQCTH
jgi:hypothetical protein